ncbi:MAG: nuclear transport factor 2 family protein [Gammaproteobacteria bacterium]|nr:nuclear transport factor 2 family protein [Gammaproteobacteria bacterium]MBT5221668.1 nuclear transport factor 2 family protein [Gammaproteobacteria bacterium]MBT5826009.1 nuclear transport factor 2 family protein [Gammaproteobacteria bacterium]MBT5966631.1 nuclear transport factor 2 family protein [Gammaproteobacteria bacterium]MBT6420974.1 nuclear transport factor 2 family protein [Gammaproteobacteria bacterium]
MRILPILFILLSACSGNSLDSQAQYLDLINTPQVLQMDSRIENFANLYNDLDHINVQAATEKTYADTFFFNDTLVTIDNRKELIAYLEQTQQEVEVMSLEVVNVLEKGQDIFVHWKMHTQFSILGKRSKVDSLGISHLRFDDQGKIILHQDYWDSTNGLFQHIPIIGGLILWVKNRLH